MVITVEPILPTDRPTLRNLCQFYEYDFSEIQPMAVGADGRYHQLDDVAFGHGYFIRVDDALAGFALVNRQRSKLGDYDVWWMEEFFVLRAQRRAGVGLTAARLVFERHPGEWEVTQTPSNRQAVAFWRHVLAAYGFADAEYQDPRWGPRSLQRFSIIPVQG
jgi:predicted acetyltransferase